MSSAIVDALRAELQARAPFVGVESGRATGLTGLDALIRGLPGGALTVVSAELGTGGTRLAAQLLAHSAVEGAPVAWVDASRTLYPPALAQEGLELRRMLLVRRAHECVVAALEEILESGLFAATAATGLEPWLTPPRLRRVQRAAEACPGPTVLVLHPQAARTVHGAALRLGLQAANEDRCLQLRVEKDRRGQVQGQTGRFELPPLVPIRG